MKVITIAILGLTLLTVGRGVCRGASIYQFEGPRRASASIEETSTLFSIETSLIPVSAFDPSTNEQLNRAKAQSIALMALTRHLNLSPTSELSVSELRTTDFRTDFSRLVMQLEVPKATVRVVQRPAASAGRAPDAMPAPAMTGAPGVSSLLTRKGDYLDTVAQLQEVQVSAVAAIAAPGTSDEELAGVEQAIAGQFSAMRQAVEADLLLLTIEREEVYAALVAAQQNLTKQLAKARTGARAASPSAASTRELDQ